MSLIVGENSYMTVAEADAFIQQMFLSTSAEREYWSSLSDDDKEILLMNMTQQVDIPLMMYKGSKVSSDQDMEWPRVINGKTVECPNSIKMGMLKQLFYNHFASVSEEYKLKNMGVKSFADGGGAKIEFASASDSVSSTSLNNIGISKDIWRIYFNEWSYIV